MSDTQMAWSIVSLALIGAVLGIIGILLDRRKERAERLNAAVARHPARKRPQSTWTPLSRQEREAWDDIVLDYDVCTADEPERGQR